MVVVNVPKLHTRKLHALIGILAATAALPTGCGGDDFEGCEASRTCPVKGGEAGNGSGGESGGGADNGGSSGSGRGGNSGTSGSGGTDDGGEAGTSDTGGSGGSGGSGDDDTEPPTIVSITPGDGDVDVERDVTVTIEFSEAIDEDSVTETSVVLTGPDGDVEGTLGVDDNVVTFTSEKKLYLLGDYTIAIDETVADLAGNTLEEEGSVGFRVRDGRWGQPVYPFGETVPRVVTHFQRNVLGDVVIGVEVWPGHESIHAVTYDVSEERWTASTALPAVPGAQFGGPFPVAISTEGSALVSWGTGTEFGWSRSRDGAVWLDAGALEGYANVAVQSADTAVAAWESPSSSRAVRARTMNLVDGVVQPESGPALSDVVYGPYPVISLDRIAVFATRTASAVTEIVVTWKVGQSWTTPEVLGSAATMGQFNVDSDEEGNIMVIWCEGDQVWSRVYDRATDQWSRELFVATGPGALTGFVDMTAGNAVVSFNAFDPDPATWLAVYDAEEGWVEDSIERLDGDWTGWRVGVSINATGRALATWHNTELRSRRYLPGEGWRAPVPGPTVELNPYYLWSAEAPDGTVTVVTNSLLGVDDQIPWSIRFE